jgi:hypothetical protein
MEQNIGDEEELILLEHKRYEALIAGDWSAYDALLGDEFFHNHVLGGTLAKVPHFEYLKAGKSMIRSFVLEDLEVRLYGEVAVVTGVSHVDLTHVDIDELAALTGVSHSPGNITRHSRQLHVWAKREGKWKLVARQATYLPGQK